MILELTTGIAVGASFAVFLAMRGQKKVHDAQMRRYDAMIEHYRAMLDNSHARIREMQELQNDRVRLEVGLPPKAEVEPLLPKMTLPDAVQKFLEGFDDVNDRADFELAALEYAMQFSAMPPAGQIIAHISRGQPAFQ